LGIFTARWWSPTPIRGRNIRARRSDGVTPRNFRPPCLPARIGLNGRSEGVDAAFAGHAITTAARPFPRAPCAAPSGCLLPGCALFPVGVQPKGLSMADELDARAAGARRLRDKVCVVTGAGQGIGRAAARRLGQEGGKIVVADRVEASATRTEAELRERGV